MEHRAEDPSCLMGCAPDAWPSAAPPRRRIGAGRLILGMMIVGVLAAAIGCKKEEPVTNSGTGSNDGYTVEPAAEIGPDAFTAPFTVDPGVCNKNEFVGFLQSRPEALREWAKVLGMPIEAVPAYVSTLQPYVLTVDTKVTNHGLRNGQAYPRQSVLTAGTAVLVDQEFLARLGPAGSSTPSASGVGTSSPPSSGASSTSGVPTTPGPVPTTVPGGGFPVTRCKCGNPLLPPGMTIFVPGTGTSMPGTSLIITTTTSVSRSSTSTNQTSSSSSSVPGSTSTSSSVPASSSSVASSTSTSTHSPSTTVQYPPGPPGVG